MYHKVKVGNLSNPQISRLLNGHGVRVSDGSNHEIELSKEQLKKFMKAREKGKAITLTMDPFQMQNHQYLRGSGSGGSSGAGNLTRTSKGSTKRLITSATDRLVRALEGSGSGGSVNRLKKYSRWTGAINKTIRDGIDTSGKAARVYYDSTGPMAQLGFGLKKRKPKKSMKGSALMPAGY